jgi:dUTP pyrophosphatase
MADAFLDLAPPTYASSGAAGADLRAAVAEPLVVAPGARLVVPTGLVLEIPAGFEGQVRARSGLALKKGLALANGVGTIDADYRGEVGVLVVNLGDEPVTLARGERIAQLVIAPVARAVFEEASGLGETARGGGGFGSTGAR